MITDQFTAKVLASVIFIMTFLIDVGCFIFTKPEISHKATFPLVVLLPSLPIILFATILFRRASKLKPGGD